MMDLLTLDPAHLSSMIPNIWIEYDHHNVKERILCNVRIPNKLTLPIGQVSRPI
jgi:hypothetical protein